MNPSRLSTFIGQVAACGATASALCDRIVLVIAGESSPNEVVKTIFQHGNDELVPGLISFGNLELDPEVGALGEESGMPLLQAGASHAPYTARMAEIALGAIPAGCYAIVAESDSRELRQFCGEIQARLEPMQMAMAA